MNRLFSFAVVGTMAASMFACASTISFQLMPLQVATQTIEVQVADTTAKRMRGLMEQKPLINGMLLLNEQPRDMILWMKNTPSDLDVAFIDASWHIIKITQMQANTETLHASEQPVIAALEMPLHWFAEHQIKVGDKVQNCQQLKDSCRN